MMTEKSSRWPHTSARFALYHRDFVSTKPSIMSRASLTLARAILGRPEANDGEWDHSENVTLLALSQHLSQPSPTLARKYSTPHMSRVSQKLVDFMAGQAAMAARNANPPTPPSDMSSKQGDIYSTPQKGHGAAMGFEGYLTPPITPDGACFGNGNQNVAKDAYHMPPRCPVTPTPQQHTPVTPNKRAQYIGFPYTTSITRHSSTIGFLVSSPHCVVKGSPNGVSEKENTYGVGI
ncbi:hypothetical protein J3459_016058 [Metarhizium acridum]|nr:hypothetical protein J3459_016058 [Metarhizium acridum]